MTHDDQATETSRIHHSMIQFLINAWIQGKTQQ